MFLEKPSMAKGRLQIFYGLFGIQTTTSVLFDRNYVRTSTSGCNSSRSSSNKGLIMRITKGGGSARSLARTQLLTSTAFTVKSWCAFWLNLLTTSTEEKCMCGSSCTSFTTTHSSSVPMAQQRALRRTICRWRSERVSKTFITARPRSRNGSPSTKYLIHRRVTYRPRVP